MRFMKAGKLAGTDCPICGSQTTYELTKDGCDYFQCSACDFLFHRAEGLNKGCDYKEDYWAAERNEALRREREDSFIRALELIFVSTIKVENILDFGCGAGVTVSMLREQLSLNAVG